MRHIHQTISVWQSATVVGTTKVRATEVGTTKVSANKVDTTKVSATEVVNRIKRNTYDVSPGILVGALVAWAGTNQFVTNLRCRTLGETVTHTGI